MKPSDRAVRPVALLLDIGNVLFAPHPDLAPLVAQAAARIGLSPEVLAAGLWHGPDVEAANVGAITAEEYAARTALRVGAGIDRAAEILALIEEIFAGARIDEELAACARRLRAERGVCVAALTNNWSFLPRLMERRGAADLFDRVVSSAIVGVTKPDPRLFRIALECIGVEPAQAVFVDDSEENVRAARALGIPAVPFGLTRQAIAEVYSLFGG
jgi:putative hydrolase of the HAD superfamily